MPTYKDVDEIRKEIEAGKKNLHFKSDENAQVCAGVLAFVEGVIDRVPGIEDIKRQTPEYKNVKAILSIIDKHYNKYIFGCTYDLTDMEKEAVMDFSNDITCEIYDLFNLPEDFESEVKE